jgi:hypothetical protein
VADVIGQIRLILSNQPLTLSQVLQADCAPRPGTDGRLVGDGTVNIQDVLRCLRYVVGLLPAQEFFPPLMVYSSPGFRESGRVYGCLRSDLNPEDFDLYFYIYLPDNGGEWTKPTFAEPRLFIAENRLWSSAYWTGGTDGDAVRFTFVLVKKGYVPPVCGPCSSLPVSEDDPNVVAIARVHRPIPVRSLVFSGIEWTVKDSEIGRISPGPNYFSAKAQDVWVDAEGLHLTIRHRNGRVYASEVIAKPTMRHGRYVFHVRALLWLLSPMVVLGFFTWDSDPAAAPWFYREIDIEISGFGEGPTKLYFTVQPWQVTENGRNFPLPADVTETTHVIDWRPDRIEFASYRGLHTDTFPEEQKIASWSYSGEYQKPAGQGSARINLWPFEGALLPELQDVEVVIPYFSYQPLVGG